MQSIFSECILKRVGSKESSQPYLISRAILLPCLQHKDPFYLKFVLFILVMPATNTVSERSFSGLHHVKDYCRSTMSQCRLNNLMVLKVHSERTGQLDMKTIGNEFITDF